MAIDEKSPDAVEKAPEYLELFNSVTELQEKLNQLKASATFNDPLTSIPPDIGCNAVHQHRILPDIGTSIWTFTGHGTFNDAEDWISSVDRLGHVNQWWLRYQLL